MELLTTYFDIIIAISIVVALSVLLHISRKVNFLIKKDYDERIPERLHLMEEELEHYIARSKRRLDIFRKVIDGFDHIVQNVKGIIAEEEQEELTKVIHEDKKELLEEQEKKEAEVIRIDQEISKP